ncbi:hypothetical protein V6R21_24840 [Limibacter armeniacum]|uniref:hypothetical protein n=1 Tax=Limibacter armeniacum TaxID=466084 RepID=UPI002FE61094
MALIDKVKDILDELGPHGWETLFNEFGLDITVDDLEHELHKELNIDRDFPGFKDFSLIGTKAIEPGKPELSLLYHAFASPNVVWVDKNAQNKIPKFPSYEQLEIIENYIYASSQKSLDDFLSAHASGDLAIVVFSNQYRTAVDTPHEMHADMVYSRTGVARLGNASSLYNAEKRGFEPLTKNPNEIRVLPAKYNLYIGLRQNGSSDILGKRFNLTLPIDFTNTPSDENLSFWVPIHKLFNGDECLEGINLNFNLDSVHSNEKIARIHNYISSAFSSDTGSNPADRDSYPYKFEENIAVFDKTNNLVQPVVHPALVEKAEKNGINFTLKKRFKIPVNSEGRPRPLIRNNNSLALFSSSLEMRESGRVNPISQVSTGDQRSVPEYAHIRTEINNGSETDLNNLANIEAELARKDYESIHYVDFSGDGFVGVKFDDGSFDFANWRTINAYSIVAPPDYFPYCDQVELFDSLRHRRVWSRAAQALCDLRLLPNIQSHQELLFEGIEAFDTCTSLICANTSNGRTQSGHETKIEHRISYLTDAASGVFAPGWDTSFDMVSNGQVNIPHLAAYGLGSPFPEDAKLCAALSSFWPAVAPDIARSFFWNGRIGNTIIPLTDEEIGSNGDLGWDGEHGPVITVVEGEELIRFKKFEYVDYTINAFENKFDYHKLAKIDTEEYLNRVNRFIQVKSRVQNSEGLISFNIKNNDYIFRFLLDSSVDSEGMDWITLKIKDSVTIVVDSNNQIQVT